MIHDVYTNIRQHSGATRPSREVNARLPRLQDCRDSPLGLGQVAVSQKQLAQPRRARLLQGTLAARRG